MDTNDLMRIAEKIMNEEQQHDVSVFLRDGRTDLAKELLRLRIDTLYSRGEMTREVALELYNRLQLPPEFAGLFPQRIRIRC